MLSGRFSCDGWSLFAGRYIAGKRPAVQHRLGAFHAIFSEIARAKRRTCWSKLEKTGGPRTITLPFQFGSPAAHAVPAFPSPDYNHIPMFNRWYIVGVLACWLASMSWLFVEKILPTLTEGQRPQYSEVLPAPAAPPRQVCWQIEYRGEVIGEARTMSRREIDGAGKVESNIQFDDLPLSEIMSELLGSFGNLIGPLWTGDQNLRLKMNVSSEMNVATDGNLESFTTEVRISDLPNVIRIEGVADGGLLKIAVLTADDETGEMRVRYRHEIDLPDEAMVSDSLSPQDRLTQLKIGQTWTIPVYRPFPPNAPVKMVQAKVERRVVFVWNNHSLRAFQVVYRDDVGSGITIGREPIGSMWVRDDGVVLQQEARMANMRVRFIRLPDEACE